jgi:hypothetical protein
MPKIDYKKEMHDLYKPSAKQVAAVNVPAMNFLRIDGAGDPNTSISFKQAIEALFSVSYTLKFMIKKSDLAIDYGVMPLEGLWWAEDMTTFSIEDKSNWLWTLQIMQPEPVTAELAQQAMAQVQQKKSLSALPQVRYESFSEGPAIQIMHLGPFSAEKPNIDRLHEWIDAQGFSRSGKHHEIYLNDFTKTAPERLKTILRQPYQN